MQCICTHCGSSQYVKNGKTNGVQRYKCKNCNRSFGDNFRKFSYKDKQTFLDLYLNGFGVRASARFLGCSHPLLLRWIKKLAQIVREELISATNNLEENTLPDVIEMDEIYTRVKKGETKYPFGLLILDNEVKLLPIK